RPRRRTFLTARTIPSIIPDREAHTGCGRTTSDGPTPKDLRTPTSPPRISNATVRTPVANHTEQERVSFGACDAPDVAYNQKPSKRSNMSGSWEVL
ncbi:hypothetical protein FRC11_004336, partial [Ceratobasidium sp. 423]